MSDQFPPQHDPSEPEYLGPGSTAGPADSDPQKGRRWSVVAAGAAGVVLAAGAGAWGVAQLLSGGDAPASAVPSIAVAYLSMDLDPSAPQKIEALRMLKKFPALDKELGLDARDDLRRWMFERSQDDGLCLEVDYARDIEPWLGDRMAIAAVPDNDAPLAPLLAVQVSDREAARAGVNALEQCEKNADGPKASGVAFVGDYMLLTERQDDADALAKAAEAASLEDDPAFSTWMDRLGDPGFITAYVSAEGPRLMADAGSAQGTADLGGMRTLWKDFEGMAGVVRFSDGTIESEFAAGGLPAGTAGAEATGPSLASLPDTTAAAFTTSLPNNWLRNYVNSLSSLALGSGEKPEELWAEMEAGTGLSLPEDIETMFGRGVSLSLDSSADLGKLTGSPDVPTLPVALRISGDPGEITRVIDVLRARFGPMADSIIVESGDGLVVVGLQQEYVDTLVAGDGGLGETEAFTAVIPDADRASAAFYVDFDAGGWLDKLAADNTEAATNLKPLDALGMSAWEDDGVQYGRFRLGIE